MIFPLLFDLTKMPKRFLFHWFRKLFQWNSLGTMAFTIFIFLFYLNLEKIVTFALSHIFMKGKWETCRLFELLKILDLW